MKAKRYFGDSICPRLGYCHSRRPPAPPNDIPQRNFRPHIHPQKIRLRLPSRSQQPCRPRHTFAHGKHLPTANIRPRLSPPTAANTTTAAWPTDRPPSGQTPADARRFCRSAGRTGLENLRGGWLCTHPLFQNAMCKSHKLHCFSKPLLEKALTARRRRVIVTGTRARPKAFFLPSGFFAPCFPLHSSCSLSTDVRQAGGRVSTKVNPRFFAARPDAGFPAA